MGHSNRSLEDFLEIISSYKIEIIIDVRRWPASLKYPYFNSKILSSTLLNRKIRYEWIEELSGYRKFGKDVEDLGLASCFRSKGFRAYATYILRSGKAKSALNKILDLSEKNTIAIMCAEKLPWRCHRKIISDWLVAKRNKVIHIIEKDTTVLHKLSDCAFVDNGELNYL